MPYPDEQIAPILNDFRRAASEQLFLARLSAFEREAAVDAAMFELLAADLKPWAATEPADELIVTEPSAGVETDGGTVADTGLSDEGDLALLDKPAIDDVASGNFDRNEKDIFSTAKTSKNVHPARTDCKLEKKGWNGRGEGRCAVGMPSPTSSPCFNTPFGAPAGRPRRNDGSAAEGRPSSRLRDDGGARVRSQARARDMRAVITSGATSVILKPWSRLTSAERFGEAIRHAAAHDGRAVTLNLSIGREVGTIWSDDPMRNIQKRINEALNRHGLAGLSLGLHLEMEPVTGRLHLHGVLVPGHHSLKAIKNALREGAGFIRGRSGSRQIKLKRITDANGWGRYLRKTARRTSQTVDHHRMIWVTQTLTGQARDHYEEVRRGKMPANRNVCSLGLPEITPASCSA